MPVLRSGITITVLILCVGIVGQAQVPDKKAEALVSCPIMVQPEPPPYGLAKAVLISLWYAKTAAQRGDEMKEEVKKANSVFAQVTAMMRSTKLATNDFICAKQPLKPFATNRSSEDVRLTAVALLDAYDQHIDIDRRLIDLLKKMDSITQSEFMDQISTLQVERGQRFSDLFQPAGLALMLLVDADRPDEKGGTRWLKITNAQKQALLDWAYEYFPEFKNKTPKDQWSDPAKTAELYLVFLNEHRGSDEKLKPEGTQ
jgi:hypothetical protein